MKNPTNHHVTATFMGTNLMAGYKRGRRVPLQLRRDNGKVYLIHGPTQAIHVVYESEEEFANEWHDVQESKPLPN